MNQHLANIASLADAIRLCRAAPLPADTPDLAGIAAEFAATVAKLGPDKTSQAGPMADAALNLFRIARSSSDGATLRACLSGMLAAGRFGRLLAGRVITGMTVSLHEMAAVVAQLPTYSRLALAHEMLCDMRTIPDKPLFSWLEGLVRPLVETEPDGLMPFLADLAREGEILAFPVRQALADRGFEQWLESRLTSGAEGTDLDRLCLAMAALDSPELAASLIRAMAAGLTRPTPTALRTVAALTEADNRAALDMFLKTLASCSRTRCDVSLAGACLDGIIAQDNPATGRLMATIRQKKPSLRRVADSRVPLLGDTTFAAYIAALPADQRAGAGADGLTALRAVAPDFVESAGRGGAIRRAASPSHPSQPAETQPDETKPATCPKQGLLARLLGPRRKTLDTMLTDQRNIRDMDLARSRVQGRELDGRELTGLDLSDSTFTSVTFLRVKVAGSRLTGSVFSGCSATGCAFTATDFSGADITDAAFTKCTFTDCDFTGAAISGCTFTGCRFQTSAFGGAALLDMRLTRTVFTASALAGSTLHGVRARSCRFEDTDFTAASFTDCAMAGLEFSNCVITAANLDGCALHSATMPGTTVTGCRVQASDIPHSLFLGNRLDRLPKAADRFASQNLENATDAGEDSQPDNAVAISHDWSRELTFMRRERSIQMANRKRLARAVGRLAPEKRAYLHMLPHLLATDLFETRFGLDNVPACEIWGYSPTLTAIELCRQFFPGTTPSGTRARLRILAVYAMGSFGTVAQTAQSDIDCWVCYDGEADPGIEAGLRRKLDALGLWAESEFGLEAHFFPMRMDDVRDNRFSSGDEESSGSAQALLLKEEFYRTAVRIAGKHLAWWVTPAGADISTHDACVRAAQRYPAMGRPRLEDFGHLAPVPPDEYFGGSLWQMVKAIHSPFKSVLKLGLLETYADPAASHLPLCDRIKRNLFMNRRGIRRTDPYAGLFSTLRTYYTDRGDTKAASLLTESFRLKASLRDMEFFLGAPARMEDASLVATLFGRECSEPERRCQSEASWTFGKSLKMGDAVRDYMVSTYQRIQASLSEGARRDVRINPEDLTRMGRRIAANFSPKPHKVMRVPFMDAQGGAFALLHFSARKAPGKKTVWITRGGSRAEAKKPSSALHILHTGDDPAHMLAWLLANRLHTPRTLLQGDRTMAPLSLADLQKLMPAMHEFFPYAQTFEPDINEGLTPERVNRAFFIFNLTAAPDQKRIEQVSVIYSTNWGEMFCRTFHHPGPILERQPSQFLAEALNQPVTDIPRMAQFLPKGSQCKRINLI
ncbi:adenylate cyclase [Pseudodesulfovibrio sp. F-1]|uniref:Adenylate cyclase n=2 Tax=Pseudodesulfovibrio alkaliphilus TaxID=2661613 RepID=A0A7K1KK17_9BACT|nr:adenylate cyclase [Pseudodesulfovibrio alkaliphilus]